MSLNIHKSKNALNSSRRAIALTLITMYEAIDVLETMSMEILYD
jgi:hypothetical protein